ncbi:hypothetical protein Zmor_016328 [Zophobas morio]|jgi:hypothetical protein|uniref:Uncharacterized protein n=1 Tax=Zophobas morio TaxID=2755281 RepID=A0AA38HGF6_9CUCU|nr:hypothetical protein Zmor_016328 [Zophobas morio]
MALLNLNKLIEIFWRKKKKQAILKSHNVRSAVGMLDQRYFAKPLSIIKSVAARGRAQETDHSPDCKEHRKTDVLVFTSSTLT